MIGAEVKTENHTDRVIKAVDEAAFKNLGHAAATIRKDAVESIVVAEGPSPEGTPPHTRRRQLKRAIRFDYDKADQSAVVGPMASIVGESAAAHELGGDFHGQEFPERPFMVPAMEKNLDRFAGDWAGSIGG
ncbi:MAG TPA: hypothetical protein VJ809_01000 [Pirellulales bacterium]|nr:hypothetical protein [Pirellulales bacterium]